VLRRCRHFAHGQSTDTAVTRARDRAGPPRRHERSAIPRRAPERRLIPPGWRMIVRNGSANRRPGLALPLAIGFAGTAAICVVSAVPVFDPGPAGALGRARELDAYALAHGGLERFVAERAALVRTGTPDSAEQVTLEAPAGTSAVELTRV